MPIFKTSFSKFSLKKGVQNGAKIDIKTLVIFSIYEHQENERLALTRAQFGGVKT